MRLFLARAIFLVSFARIKNIYMKEIKWGFIGCGEVTEKKSGPAFSEVEGSSVVAVMARSEHHAHDYAKRHHIRKWYTDPQELINDPDVNAVYIATPPSSHATYAIMSMRSGKPCYVEKPLASSYDDCLRINRTSQLTGVPCYVAYYRRYLPYFQKVEEIIRQGLIGKVLSVQLRFVWPPRPGDDAPYDKLPWRLHKDVAGGGYFYDLAPHQMDLLQQLFGVIVRAHGYCANRAGLYEVEDTVNAVYQFSSGLSGSGSWCFAGHESAKEDRVEVIGTQGMLCFSVFSYDPIHLHLSDGTHTINVPNPPYVQLPIVTAVVKALQGIGTCSSSSVSATPTNWVLDRILGKI